MNGLSPECGVLALALVNTRPTPRLPDALRTPEETHRWVVAQLDVKPTAFSLPAERELLDEGHRLRAAIDRLFQTASSGSALPRAELATLERALAAARWSRRVDFAESGLFLRESPVSTSDPLALLAPFSWDALTVLAAVDPARVRRCAATDCGRWLIDTSKGGQRRWCSMASCGNRMKAMRYREKHAPRGVA